MAIAFNYWQKIYILFLVLNNTDSSLSPLIIYKISFHLFSNLNLLLLLFYYHSNSSNIYYYSIIDHAKIKTANRDATPLADV